MNSHEKELRRALSIVVALDRRARDGTLDEAAIEHLKAAEALICEARSREVLEAFRLLVAKGTLPAHDPTPQPIRVMGASDDEGRHLPSHVRRDWQDVTPGR